MKYYLFFLLSFFSLNAQKNDNYFDYHDKINKAEILYFLEKKTDSSLLVYDEVFNDFEFIFLKDLLVAAQIAKFNNKEFDKYIFKGFEFGLKIDDLKRFPVLKSNFYKYSNDKEVLNKFKEGRKKYLQKIDFDYLDYVYDLAIRDQIYKYKDDYDNRINKTIAELIDTIKKKGFPGERRLGITDTLIFKEKGLFKKDINDRARKLKITKHFVYNSNRLQFDTSIPMFLHHKCVFNKYESILLNEVKKGNVHPQDLAFFNDFNLMYQSTLPSYCKGCKSEGAYYLSKRRSVLESEIEIKNANLLREKMHMIPFEVVLIKEKFAIENNFILNFGYNGGARL